MTNENNKKNTDDKDAFIQTARERYRLAEEALSDIYTKAQSDLEFLSGEQWPQNIKTQREQDDRPCLTINRMPQFVRQITNEQRQNRPAIKVTPFDDNADPETAKIYQGLIRHIENNSNANAAYNTGFEGAVIGGFGYFRLRTDYCDPQSFDQEILIERIRDHFSVKLDPFSKELDGSDANWGFIEDEISLDDFKRLYPEAELSSDSGIDSLTSVGGGWLRDKSVKICEYFYKEYENVALVQLSDGSVVKKSDLPKPPEILPPGVTVVNERVSKVPVVKWAKINGIELIEQRELPGQWIPIIPVYGNELIVKGKRILEGILRHAKDSQTMYNFWATSETETIALAPKAPFLVAEGQIPKEYEGQWRTANKKNHAFLVYKAIGPTGQPLGPPTRNTYEPPIAAITNARMQSSEDIKATTGIYDSALGAKSNENSGVAIQRRNQQSQTTNYHFIDNFNLSLRHAGRLIVEWIPKIYDSARAVRILGEDGKEEIVRINQIFQNEKGEQQIHDLSVGKYDVVIETGPSFATKRQEAVASMIEFIGAYPAAAQVIGDLLAKNMDWPGASEISERLKKMLPPNMLDDADKQLPPEAKAQMDQMGQMIDQLTAHLNEANEKVKNKTLELESKERIEVMKLEQEATIELAKLQSKEAVELISHQMSELNQRLSLVGINEPYPQETNEIEAGPNHGMAPENEYQQPTGGQSPGNYMEGQQP